MKKLLDHFRLKRPPEPETAGIPAVPAKPIEKPVQPVFTPPAAPRAVRPAWHTPSVPVAQAKKTPSKSAKPSQPDRAAAKELLTLSLGDFLDRIPAAMLDGQEHDRDMPLPFDIGVLSERMGRGETVMQVGELYRRLPDIFRSDAIVTPETTVPFPWKKVLSLIEQTRAGSTVPGLTQSGLDTFSQKLKARRLRRPSKMAPLPGANTPATDAENGQDPRLEAGQLTETSGTEMALLMPEPLPPPAALGSAAPSKAALGELSEKYLRLQKAYEELAQVNEALKVAGDKASSRATELDRAVAENAKACAERDEVVARSAALTSERDAARAQMAKLAADSKAAASLAKELTAQRNTSDNRVKELTAALNTAFAEAADLRTANAAPAGPPAAESETAAARLAELTAEREAAAATTAQLTAERDAATATIERLTTERDAAVAETAKLTDDSQAAAELVRQLTAEREAAAARLAELTAERATGVTGTEQLTAERDAARAETARLAADSEAALALAAELTAQRDAAVASTAELTSERDAALAEVAKLTTAGAAAAELASEWTAEREAAAARLAAVITERDAAVQRAEELRKPVTSEANTAEQAVWQSRAVAQLQEDIDAYRKTIRGLCSERDALRAEQEQLAARQAPPGGAAMETPSSDAYSAIFPERKTNSRIAAVLLLALLACGIFSQWPFGSAPQAAPERPIAAAPPEDPAPAAPAASSLAEEIFTFEIPVGEDSDWMLLAEPLLDANTALR